MERLQIRARTPGTVLSIQTRSGEAVSSDGILRMADLDHLMVVADVDQSQIQLIKTGMSAVIDTPLLGKPVDAIVTRVGGEVFRQKRPSSDILVGRDAQIVEVELTPQQPLPIVVGVEVKVEIRLRNNS